MMPYKSNTIITELDNISIASGPTYAYSGLSGIDNNRSHSSQIQVLFYFDQFQNGTNVSDYTWDNWYDPYLLPVKTDEGTTILNYDQSTQTVTITNTEAITRTDANGTGGLQLPTFNNGTYIRILRSQNVTNPSHTFGAGTRVTSTALNNSFGQVFDSIQELDDRLIRVEGSAFEDGFAFSNLTDVNVSGSSTWDVLRWNGSSWVNDQMDASRISTGTLSNDRLSNVPVSKLAGVLADSQVAQSNVTQYATDVAAAIELNDISNVAATLVTDNSFIVYDFGTSNWTALSPANTRTALGLGTAALNNTGDFAAASHTHTLSNITDAGTAAASDTGDFEPSGAVSSHSATTSGVHGISAYGATLVDDADAATARTTLGLGTAATSNTGDFAPTLHTHTLSQITDAGTAAASNTGDFEASGAVSTHAAVTSGVHGISAFGATLVDDADASAARTTLGLGTAATSNTGDFAAASHTHALGDLSDVDTAGATTGQVLEFDGADWVPATPSAGAAALNDLTDVSTAGATTGDVIVYNGSTWAPAAQSGGGEIVSDAENGVGENSVTNIIAITQAQYDALTPQADTFYIITDATAGTDYTTSPEATTVRLFDDMTHVGVTNPILGDLGAVCYIGGSGFSWRGGYSVGSQEFDDDDAIGVLWAQENGAYDRGTLYGPISVLRYAPSDGDKCLFECRVKFNFAAGNTNSFVSVGFISHVNNVNQQSYDLGSNYTAASCAGVKFGAGNSYLKSFVKDNYGVGDNPTFADITSVSVTNDTWYRVGAVCTYDAANTRWVVDSYINGTLVDTQYLTTWGPPLTYGLLCFQNNNIQTNLYYVDWVSCEYTRWTTPTLLHIEDV